MKLVTALFAGLALCSSAFGAQSLYRTDEANINPVRTQNYEIHRVSGTDKYVVSTYTVQDGNVLVSTRVFDALNGSGVADKPLEQNSAKAKTPGFQPADSAPAGCGSGCTLVDVYSHTTPLDGCYSAVTVTYVWTDDGGGVFTQSYTSKIRSPKCAPGN